MIVAGGRDKKQDGGSVDAVSIQKLISSVANDNVPGGRVSAAYWRVRAFVGCGGWSGAWWAWVRFAAMSHAPADVLSDMAACCLYGGGRWDVTRQVVSNLCDNTALPDSVFRVLVDTFGEDLPELGACNPRYANEVSRRVILGGEEGFREDGVLPDAVLGAVRHGIVTAGDVLAYLLKPREWWVEYAGPAGHPAGADSQSEWSSTDAARLRGRMR